MSAEADAVMRSLRGFKIGDEVRALVQPERFPRCWLTGCNGGRGEIAGHNSKGLPYWNVRFDAPGGTSTWWEGGFEHAD